MENQNYNVVKYSYSTYFKQEQGNGAAGYCNAKTARPESSILSKYNSITQASDCVVGIKFDNIPDRKLINRFFTAQGQKTVKKDIVATGYFNWQSITLQSGFASGDMVWADDCNEPTVLCQSTFL